MRRFSGSMLTLVFALALSVPLQSASDKPKRGGTLTLAVRKDLALLNPLVGTKSTDRKIRELMFEPLLGIDLKGNIQPNLATAWEVSDDGKVYTFKIRQGVKFHNGQEMTAKDVKFAMDYTMNPKNGARGLIFLSIVDRVEVSDSHTLKVFLKAVSPGFLASITDIRAFSVIPNESLPEGIDKITSYPPGTGPFKFVEWKPRQRIVLERNDDYWGHKAFIDRLIFRPIRNATVRFTALRAGDVDLITRAPFEWVKQIVDGKFKGIKFVESSHDQFLNIQFNVVDPPFNNQKLRQAVAHAINRKEMLEAAYFGFGDPTDQKYPKKHTWYLEGVPVVPNDLAKAKALLKKSGYKGQGIDLLIQPGQESEATVLQAQLKRIGMNIKLDLLESGAYSTRVRKGDFAFNFGGGSADADPTVAYAPDLGCEPDPTKRANNDSGYCSKEMDRLLKKAETELDPIKRRELFKQVASKVVEDLPELYVGFIPTFFASRDYVKGFVTDNNGALQWWGGGLNRTWLDK